ncbi:MAG TPA: S8 family peptidase [Stenotrophomonas sp.]|nr:S8 family peptidase [Stenotrophomonas sp.]
MNAMISRGKAALALGIALALSAVTDADAATPKAVVRLPAASAKVLAQAPVDRFIVKYREGSSQRRDSTLALDSMRVALHGAGLSGAGTRSTGPQLQRVRRLAQGAELVRTTRALSRTEADRFLAQLRTDPQVQYAQVDARMYANAAAPNDPQFTPLQWDFTDATGGVNALPAWDTSRGEGVVVAVLDTGYTDHPDLADNLLPGYDFVSYYGQDIDGELAPDVAGDGDGRDPDAHDPGDWVDASMSGWCPAAPNHSSWHGTHVAGTVAAVANNGRDIAGLAPGTKVQPVRVLGHCGGSTSDIADAITWASGGHVDGVPDNPTPAEVLNLSLGGYNPCEYDYVTQEAIDGAIARGSTVVVAAGNDAGNVADYSPAGCKGVITVGATGVDGARSYFSNYGTGVAIAAPGGNATSGSDPANRWIWSLGNAGATVPGTAVLMGMIGTSQASPHVAAIAAMMQAAAVGAGQPALTPQQLRLVLQRTARAFPVAPAAATPIGVGIVDAAAAVQAATQSQTSDVTTALGNRAAWVEPSIFAGDSKLYTINVPAGAASLSLRTYGGTGNVSLYVARERVPTAASADYRSARTGNTETVQVIRPAAGIWYLRVQGEMTSSNVSVMAAF